MDQAAILKTGYAYKISNITPLRYDLYGFLVRFKDSQNREIVYLDTELKSDNIIYLPGGIILEEGASSFNGYYYSAEFYEYVKNRKGDIASFKFNPDKELIHASINDIIELDIVSLELSSVFYSYTYYSYTIQNFKTNYLLSGSKGTRLDINIFGTGIPNTKNITGPPKFFFDNQKTLQSSLPPENQIIYLEWVIFCAIRIKMIIDDIFPLFITQENTQNNAQDINFEEIINGLKEKWNSVTLFTNIDTIITDLKNYYSNLYSFYTYCFNNHDLISNAKSDLLKFKYLILVAPVELLYVIVPSTKINLLNSITKQFRDKTDKINNKDLVKLVVKLVDSFGEQSGSDIDYFLEKLIIEDNSIPITKEVYMVNVAPIFLGYKGEEHIRTKITLFEYIYRNLKANPVVEIFQHSSLYKKINSSMNVDVETSALSSYVTKVYTLWTQSRYNPNRNNTFNPESVGYGANAATKTFKYTHKPASTFNFTTDSNGGGQILPLPIDRNKAPYILNLSRYYIYALGHLRDTIQTNFIDFDRILVTTNDIRNANVIGLPNPWASTEALNTSAYFAYGYYNLYQPIQIISSNLYSSNELTTTNHTWNDSSEVYNQTFYPAFLFHFMQEKEDNEFIYGFTWTVLEAAYKAMKSVFAGTAIIEVASAAEEIAGQTIEILEVVIPEDALNIIRDYANTCSLEEGDHFFCEKINNLVFWINNYITANNEIVPNSVRRAAQEIVVYIGSEWPEDFDGEDGSARQLIVNLAGGGSDCDDLKVMVIEKINDAQDSYNELNEIPGDPGNGQPLFSDADYLEVCNYTSDIDLSDDFNFNTNKSILVAFIFNAHRKGKQAKVAEVIERIDFWVNLKTSVALGGRGKTPYIFGQNIVTAQNNYTNFIEKMNELFAEYSFQSFADKRIGGSALYKSPPGDLDMYVFVNNRQINILVDNYSRTWAQLANETEHIGRRRQAERYSDNIKTVCKNKGLIMGYLIITYNTQFRYYHILNNDRYDPYYTSSLAYFSGSKASFDITIKDNQKDNIGTPPYIELNL